MNRRDLLQGAAAAALLAVVPGSVSAGVPPLRVWALYDTSEGRDTIKRLRARGVFKSVTVIENDLAEYGFALGDVRPGDAFWLALEHDTPQRHFERFLLHQFPRSALWRSELNV